jgi:hypothetical protein
VALKYFNVLSGISAGNITINAANNTIVANEFAGNVTGTILTSSQTNITTVGTLTSLAVTGNANVGNLAASGSITRNSRNVPTFVHQADTPPSNPLVGDQWYNTTTGVLFEYLNDGTTSQWVDINGLPGVVGPIVLPDGTANAVVYLNSSGETVSSSSFVFDGTNVGIGNTAPAHTLSVTGTINVSGNANVGNIGATNGVFTSVSGNGSSLSAIAGANVTGTVANATFATSAGSATTAGTVTTAAQPNITSVGTLTSLGVSGTITAANITANTGVFTGNGSALTALNGSNITTGTVAAERVATLNQNTTGSAATVTTAAQPNITSVGTLTSLTVNGGIRTRGGPPGALGVNNNGYAFSGNGGDTDGGMFSSADGQLEFYTDSTEKIRINSAGNVGIGTTAPTFRLVSANSATDGGWLYSAGAVSILGLGGYQGATDGAFSLRYDRSTGIITFNGGSRDTPTERMRLDASGNLSLGTTAGLARLRVASGTQINAPVLGNVTNYPIFLSGPDTAFGLGIGTNNADGRTWLQSQRADGDAATYPITLNEAGGNVGIGTTSPAQKLDVNGNIRGGVLIANSSVGYRNEFNGFQYNEWRNEHVANYKVTGNTYAYYWRTSDNGALDGANQRSIAEWYNNRLVFFTDNVERMRIDSSGNVGIGNSSPGYRLDIAAGDTTAGLGYAARLRSNATAAAAALQFTNNAVTAQNGLIACTDAGILTVQGDGASSVIAFRTNGSEAARITSGGELLVGTTAAEGPGKIASVSTASGTACVAMRNSAGASSNYAFFINAAATTIIGSITNNADTGVLYNTSSDARLKHDIVDAPDAASLIDAIRVRSFKWNADDSVQRFGMIAQELVEVAPEAVSVPQDEDQMMGVDYSKLVPILTKALQEANSKIDALEARMSALESAITNLSEGN